MTIIVGVVFLWICPEQAESAWFLTPEERMMGKERVRGNMSSLESKVWKWDGMGEALLPWRDLLVTSYCIPNGGLGNFLHLILQSYGFSPLQTILVGLPQAAAQVFIALTGSYIARRFRNSRTIVMASSPPTGLTHHSS
jgi:ACS family allantoate permease-like MFS transporter